MPQFELRWIHLPQFVQCLRHYVIVVAIIIIIVVIVINCRISILIDKQ